MLNRTEYLLICLNEEASEVAQRADKALRFGLYEIQPGQKRDNLQRLRQEFLELLAVAEMLGLISRERPEQVAGGFLKLETLGPIDEKQKKVRLYMDYSVERGTLEAARSNST